MAQAVKLIERLEKEGQSHFEAQQTAIEVILQPANSPETSDNPPTPLSQEEPRGGLPEAGLEGERPGAIKRAAAETTNPHRRDHVLPKDEDSVPLVSVAGLFECRSRAAQKSD